MAKNPAWNHSISRWKRNYSEWIAEIQPETAANFATFFDTRRVYGDRELIDELKEHIKTHLNNDSGRLFYHLAVNALKYEPPLTFFRGIRTISKDDREVFNIKHAMTPLVDMIRMYALQHQVMLTNTGERLLALYHADLITKEQYYELLQAYYYLMAMRLKSQAKTILRKQGEPTNFIEPKSLTNIERVTLREIFKVIGRFQAVLKMEFTGSAGI
jgi:CBS domain-containing protein